jgi:peptidoglycan-associated lipoprotein
VEIRLLSFLILLMIFTTGCTKKQAVPSIGAEESYRDSSTSGGGNYYSDGDSRSEQNSISIPSGDVTSEVSGEVAGGVSSTGKYTGTDGASASGIKMVYFSSDRYDIESDQMRRLLSDMPKIKKLASLGKVRVEGNCDEFGTNEYNYALGLKRAKAVRSVLINNGVPSSKISIVSYGESNPVCTGHTAPCHAKNRRVEINRI